MKLFLLDAYALIYRAYYGLIKNPRINSKGENVSAVYGFFNTLEEILTKEQPTHIGVAFDPHGGTFRHEKFPDYKAQREETPEAIRFGTPIIKEILASYHIPILEVPGYEADDVIGTLAHQAEQQGIETYMMTPDKDYGQLVSEHVRMFKPRTMKAGYDILGPKEICEKWGIDTPQQVVDILGLMGDAADNIPGCTGVGEKTAISLILQFGNIENMLQHTDEIKGKLREKIEACKEQIAFSRWLAQIVLDVPITLDMEALKVQEPDADALAAQFTNLEMFSLIRRKGFTNSQQATANSQQPTAPAKPKKKPVDDGQLSLFDALFDENEDENENSTPSQPFETSHNPSNCTAGASFGTVGYDLKPQLLEAWRKGEDLPAPYFDVMIAHYLLQPDMSHKLEYLQQAYLQPDCPNPIQALRERFEQELKEVGMWQLFTEVEMPLIAVLARMEYNGVRLDTETLAESQAVFMEQIQQLDKDIHALVDIDFNIQSPKQVGEILFDHLKLAVKAKKTASGIYSTNEEVLLKLRDKHPIVDKILEYRGKRKLVSTYVEALPKLIDPTTGHIHTSFNQAVTATGRLSSSSPNLQNIPIRSDDGKEIRRAFIPEKDELFFSADYSQIELRIMAHLSGDEGLINDFREGHDIHAATAAKVFHKRIEDVTKEERSKAKSANFGIIYGITAFGLAEQLGIPRTEAKDLIDEYFKMYPRVHAYMQESIDLAREREYTETICHRRCYLRDINESNAVVRGFAERNAINAPIQGSAADIIKIAMVAIDKKFREENLRSRMILQVHDELNFSVVPEERDRVQAIVIDAMQSAYPMQVPLIADCGWGANWLAAH